MIRTLIGEHLLEARGIERLKFPLALDGEVDPERVAQHLDPQPEPLLAVLLERLDVEHLHLDHVRRAPHVHALDVDDRILELADLGPLIRGQQRDGLDAVRVVELEDVVQEAEQGGLVVLAPEDPQEHEIGFRVGEDRAVMARDLPGSARRA